MRLISLHIDNFGILHDLDWRFGRGLNIICRENGWGKSTMAAFLAVMFYGFSGEGRRQVPENERERFRPWQGGPYGGSVTFEAGGKTYRLERQFGLRQREDTFALYDAETNLRSADFSHPAGEAIFRVDRASFERTVFTAQLSSKTSVTSAIHARIGSMDAYTDDMNRYEKVMSELKSRQVSLSPARKTGLIARKNADLLRIAIELREKDAVSGEAASLSRLIEEKRERGEQLEDELFGLRAEAEKLSEDKDRAAGEEKLRTIREERIKAALEDIAESERELEAAERYFPGRIPETAELEEIRKLQAGTAGSESALAAISLTGEEKERLEQLVRAFHAGIPDDKNYKAWQDKEKEIDRLEQWIRANSLTPEEEKEMAETEAIFKGEIPSREQFARYKDLHEEEESIRKTVAARKATMEEMRRTEKPVRIGRGRGGAVMALLYGILLIGAGAVLLVPRSPAEAFITMMFRSFGVPGARVPAGAVLAVLGALLLLLSLTLFLRRSAENARLREHLEREDVYGQMEKENDGDEAEAAKLSEVTEAFLLSFGASGKSGDIPGILDQYSRLADRCRKLQEKDRIFRESGAIEQKETITRELDKAMDRYFPEERGLDYRTRAEHIRAAAAEYGVLTKKNYHYARERSRQRQGTDAVRSYLRSLDMEPAEDLSGQLLEIHDYLTERSQCAAELARKKEMYRELLSEVPGPDAGDAGKAEELEKASESLADLNARIRELEEEKSRVLGEAKDAGYRLSSAGERLVTLREKEAEAEEIRADIARLEKKLATLELTGTYLEKARAALMVKYAEPVRRAFLKYYRLLGGENPDSFSVDAELSVSVREYGKYRDPELLSAGRRDLVAICRRMAMAEAMYPEEKPFLLMDDPFVNLDEKRREAGIRFLRRVSEDWQVIYFTCSGMM